MAYAVSLSELREMPEEQRAKAASRLIQGTASAADGQTKQFDVEIAAFEREYGITSEQLVQELYEGTRSETNDIVRWLMLLHLRGRSENY